MSTDNEEPARLSDNKDSPNVNLDKSSENFAETKDFQPQKTQLSTDTKSDEPEIPPPTKPERLKIKIKNLYIRSYQDSLEKSAKEASSIQESPVEESELEKTPKLTRRRNKQQKLEKEKEKIELPPVKTVSPPTIVSEEKDFDSQSSILGTGSVSSRSTTTTLTNSIKMRGIEDCQVIHSRGSSVVTSDLDNTSQQSSLAAAPPSELNATLGSENNSTDNNTPNELFSTGLMGEELKLFDGNPTLDVPEKASQTPKTPLKVPPEPVVAPKRATRRATRNTKNVEVEEPIIEESPVKLQPSLSIADSEPAPDPAEEIPAAKRGRRAAATKKPTKSDVKEISTSPEKPTTRRKVVEAPVVSEPEPPPTRVTRNKAVNNRVSTDICNFTFPAKNCTRLIF